MPALARPAQYRLHPGQQLLNFKGLDQIIVRAPAQTLHPVPHRRLRRDENDRHPQRFQVVQQLQPVQPRQHDVQQRQIKLPILQQVRCCQPVVRHRAGIARPAQAHFNEPRNGPLVLHDQHLCHAVPSFTGCIVHAECFGCVSAKSPFILPQFRCIIKATATLPQGGKGEQNHGCTTLYPIGV